MQKFNHYRIRQVSSVAPAVRCLCVIAWVNDNEEPGHIFEPVLYLETEVREDYTYFGTRRPDISAVPEELVGAGWNYEGDRTATFAVVCGSIDEGFSRYGLDCFEGPLCSNEALLLVACPWAAEQDSERLQPIVESLIARAAERYELAKSRRAATP